MLTREELINDFGFKELPHFTITRSLVLDIGRNRTISAASLGTPNEMLFIGEGELDCVVLHNYDYDGFLTKERLKLLIEFFNSSPYNQKKNKL